MLLFGPSQDLGESCDLFVDSSISFTLKGIRMSNVTPNQELCTSRCVPCEGGVPKLSHDEANQQIQELDGWVILDGPDRISKSWKVTNFVAGMDFLNRVTELAEDEAHHPDVHLVGYRNVTIDIWTHAIGGLSLNDFILAAKIDQLQPGQKTM